MYMYLGPQKPYGYIDDRTFLPYRNFGEAFDLAI